MGQGNDCLRQRIFVRPLDRSLRISFPILCSISFWRLQDSYAPLSFIGWGVDGIADFVVILRVV